MECYDTHFNKLWLSFDKRVKLDLRLTKLFGYGYKSWKVGERKVALNNNLVL